MREAERCLRCYRVGMLAGMASKSGKVGFIGGMDIPLIHRFENGFDAGAMFVIGGAVRGHRVHGRWPGLAPEQLYEGRDLALTTDFRAVFGFTFGFS